MTTLPELPPPDFGLELSNAAWYIGHYCISHPNTGMGTGDYYKDYRIILKYHWNRGWSIHAYHIDDDELCYIFSDGEFKYLSAHEQWFKTWKEAMKAYRDLQKREFAERF